MGRSFSAKRINKHILTPLSSPKIVNCFAELIRNFLKESFKPF